MSNIGISGPKPKNNRPVISITLLSKLSKIKGQEKEVIQRNKDVAEGKKGSNAQTY
jgi:hypothetical protein